MNTSIAFVLLCCAMIVLGAVSPKPVGWVVVALALVALLVGLVYRG